MEEKKEPLFSKKQKWRIGTAFAVAPLCALGYLSLPAETMDMAVENLDKAVMPTFYNTLKSTFLGVATFITFNDLLSKYCGFEESKAKNIGLNCGILLYCGAMFNNTLDTKQDIFSENNASQTEEIAAETKTKVFLDDNKECLNPIIAKDSEKIFFYSPKLAS